jgi:hypothetical protein
MNKHLGKICRSAISVLLIVLALREGMEMGSVTIENLSP